MNMYSFFICFVQTVSANYKRFRVAMPQFNTMLVDWSFEVAFQSKLCCSIIKFKPELVKCPLLPLLRVMQYYSHKAWTKNADNYNVLGAIVLSGWSFVG
jgi:hypothetical protein